jgi:hypothetical protein
VNEGFWTRLSTSRRDLFYFIDEFSSATIPDIPFVFSHRADAMLSWRGSRSLPCFSDHLSERLHSSILPNVPSEALQLLHSHLPAPRLLFEDRTRYGFFGLLGPFAAVLGPTSSCGKPVKALDFAGLFLVSTSETSSARLRKREVIDGTTGIEPVTSSLGITYFQTMARRK